MKRSIIILIALVLFISLPVFTSAPTQENTPMKTIEHGMFLDMTQLSEEELMGIEGNRTIIEDAYFHVGIVDKPNNDGSYSYSGWEN